MVFFIPGYMDTKGIAVAFYLRNENSVFDRKVHWDVMEIQKVINNNVISAFDESGQEVVVMGTGIGFKAHPGDPVNEEKVTEDFSHRKP